MSQRPARVMSIISRLGVGGPAIHVTLLASKLAPLGYETTLVCGTTQPHEGDMTDFARQHGVEPLILPGLGRSIDPITSIRNIRRLYRLMRDLQPDIVHTHTARAGFVGRIAARLAGVPIIVHTFHSHVFGGKFGPSSTRLFIRLERLAARYSDVLITLTEGLRRELADEYHIARRRQITVLPVGLDLERFVQTPRKSGQFRAAWNIPPDAPLVGIVGQLTPVKNHALFLQAAARLTARVPSARFVIVGDGETRPQAETLTDQLGLREVVIFTGWQSDLAAVYSDLDTLVISSLSEGTPGSIIEALAACCPVVATAVGGVPDMLDQGRLGRLAASEDADALAEGIHQSLLYPLDGKEAQRVMLDRYGIDRLVSDIDGLYRGLLAKKGRLMNRPA